jgi:3-hydroxy-3-methylglutaryl CoA synthase
MPHYTTPPQWSSDPDYVGYLQTKADETLPKVKRSLSSIPKLGEQGTAELILKLASWLNEHKEIK